MFKTNDIVRHKRRGTYGIVGLTTEGYSVLWHLGNGERILYVHKHTTKVLELAHSWESYKRYHEAGRGTLACHFGFRYERYHTRNQALSAWLDSLSTSIDLEQPLDEEAVCDCLTRETVDIKNVLSGRTLKDFQREQGMAQGALSFRSRHTGKSTGIALGAISAAILSPATPIKFLDHHKVGQAQAHLYMIVCNLIDNLGLRGLDVDKQKSTITFHPFVEARTIYEPKTITTPIR